MAMSTQLWSLNALSVELRFDRRTLGRWLSSLEPTQEKPKGRKLYLLKNVLRHLKQFDEQLPNLEEHEARQEMVHRAMHLTVTVLAENLRDQLPKTLGKVGPHRPEKAKELTHSIMRGYSWIAYRVATEVFHCVNDTMLADIARCDEPKENVDV